MTNTPRPLTSAELADLKAKAKAATSGEWRVGGLLTNQEGEIGFVNAGDDCVARCDFGFSGLPAHANAAHIAAANPDTILRLIAMVERQQKALLEIRSINSCTDSRNAARSEILRITTEALAATEPPK